MKKRSRTQYEEESSEDDIDNNNDTYQDEGDGFIVPDDEDDELTDGSYNEESEGSDEDEEAKLDLNDCDEEDEENVDSSQTGEDIQELLADARSAGVNTTKEVIQSGPRRSRRARKVPETYQDQFWGSEEKNLLLKDITDTEFQEYLENEDDPEVCTDDEEMNEDEDEDEEFIEDDDEEIDDDSEEDNLMSSPPQDVEMQEGDVSDENAKADSTTTFK